MSRRVNILRETDWLTIFLYVLLVGFGWMNIYAVNFTEGSQSFFSLSHRYTMQLLWIVVSIVLAIFIFLIDSRFYSFFAYPAYAISIFILLLVLVVGTEINGSKSWIVIGPISLQPAEFAKVATILALAKFLSGYNMKASKMKNIFISFAIIGGAPILIMLQPDFGSTLVYASLIFVLYREGLPGWILVLLAFTAMLFLSSLLYPELYIYIALTIIAFLGYAIYTRKPLNTLIGTGIMLLFTTVAYLIRYFGIYDLSNFLIFFLALASSTVLFLILAISRKIRGVFPVVVFLFAFIGFVYSFDYVFNNLLQKHQKDRVEVMLGLKSDPWGYEYNVNQSKIAIGSGGFSGKGFLQGTQTKLKYVPEQSTDFIFCTVGEEWGFVGSVLLIATFVGLLLRLIIIAERQRSKFSRIYGYGVVSIIFFHFAVNIAMTIALFPVIGIPLPFLSYGGSSLMAFSIMIFILLRLDSTRKSNLI
jgi:rod shape determining protein RodA